MSAKYWIEKLKLERHPEGGWYRRAYESQRIQPTDRGDRQLFTSIYYLLESGDFSGWHKIKSEELWAWHAGDELTIHQLDNHLVQSYKIGVDAMQHTVPANLWFAAENARNDHGFTLVSCIVAPGFDFADFTMARHKDIPKNWHQLVREL